MASRYLEANYDATCLRVSILEQVLAKLKKGTLTREERQTFYAKLYSLNTKNEVLKSLLDGEVARQEEEDMIWDMYSGAVLEQMNRRMELMSVCDTHHQSGSKRQAKSFPFNVAKRQKVLDSSQCCKRGLSSEPQGVQLGTKRRKPLLDESHQNILVLIMRT